MSVSTDGIIFFGWIFDDGHEFPWDSEREEGGDWTSWWRRVAGNPFDSRGPDGPYDERGEHKPGVTDADITAFWSAAQKWDKEHPMPFDVVNYCSAECPMYAIAMPGLGLTASRGCPEFIHPARHLPGVDFGNIESVIEICAKHGIQLEGEPKWYLASYWG